MTDTLQARVKPLLAKGLDHNQIAVKLGEPVIQVRNACWRVRNAARRAQVQREYDSKRYGTDEYRRWDRTRKNQRYHSDPLFRQGVIDAVKRYRERQKEARYAETLYHDPAR